MVVIFHSKLRKTQFEALSLLCIGHKGESSGSGLTFHRQIIDKTCVVSARDDNLQTIKDLSEQCRKKQANL